LHKPSKPTRALIIRSGALGETIFALPVLEALRAEFGNDINIDWIGTPAASALFKLDHRVNRVFHLKHRKLPIWLSLDKQAIIKASRKNPYDLLINLESGNEFITLAEKINAKQKFGRPYNHIGAPKKGEETNHPHAIEALKTLYSELVSEKNLSHAVPKLYGESIEIVHKKFQLPEKYIIINASTSHHKKFTHRAWPLAHWQQLIDLLSKEHALIIIGGKGEEKFFDQLRPFPPSVIDLVDKSSLAELITIIQCAQLLISADTGPSHIGSATDTPVFALFGPSNPAGTGPFKTPSNEVHIISANLECSPCNATDRMKACHDNQCMKQILPEHVKQNIDSFFNKKKAILDQ
jgi:ADP-heptose:LPS heptosyltransferase